MLGSDHVDKYTKFLYLQAIPRVSAWVMFHIYHIAENFCWTKILPSPRSLLPLYCRSIQWNKFSPMQYRSPYPLCSREDRIKKFADKIFANKSRWRNWWKFSPGKDFQLHMYGNSAPYWWISLFLFLKYLLLGWMDHFWNRFGPIWTMMWQLTWRAWPRPPQHWPTWSSCLLKTAKHYTSE